MWPICWTDWEELNGTELGASGGFHLQCLSPSLSSLSWCLSTFTETLHLQTQAHLSRITSVQTDLTWPLLNRGHFVFFFFPGFLKRFCSVNHEKKGWRKAEQRCDLKVSKAAGSRQAERPVSVSSSQMSWEEKCGWCIGGAHFLHLWLFSSHCK